MTNENHSDLSPELAKATLVLVRDMMCAREGESALITADVDTDEAAISAVQNACHLAGAKTATMILSPALPFQGGLADPYIPDHVSAAVPHCDIWIDLCMPYMAGSGPFDEALKAGRTRYFLGADIGAEGIVRIFGKADLDKAFAVSDALTELFSSAKGEWCRITTPAGTDVRFQIADPEGFAMSKAAGPGGYFVPGTAVLIPELETVKGTIVVDTVFHEYYTALNEPLKFEVDGNITEVSGGGPEARIMDRALRRAGNGEYGGIVHFTYGYHPTARFTGKSFVEDQRVVGCNAVGFGIPHWLPGGGENHPDCVMGSQSIWIGDEQIVDEGTLVRPEAIVNLLDELRSLYA